jgi:hypothetical protein
MRKTREQSTEEEKSVNSDTHNNKDQNGPLSRFKPVLSSFVQVGTLSQPIPRRALFEAIPVDRLQFHSTWGVTTRKNRPNDGFPEAFEDVSIIAGNICFTNFSPPPHGR